jgi:predicted ATPase/DNA-binding winged helix-turn-helix (wHTH) protein
MSSSVKVAEFGPFRLFPSERRLVMEGQLVGLGSRALDILILLVEHAGRVVTKQELIAKAWPGLTVEESSLRVQVASLRKALGGGRGANSYVVNSAGRGYSFVGRVTWHDPPQETAAASIAPRRRETGLPRRPSRMLGRDTDLGAISELLANHRFVTIHGPGGIGKTTVALAVAHERAEAFRDGVRFLDLGLRSAHDNVAEVAASELGLMVQSDDLATSIVDHLYNRQMLLVFDCCEHVIDSAAALAETIIREAPQVSILATSREALRAEGEHVYALGSLDMPPEGLSVGARQLLDYPAAQLFVERVMASGHRATFSDSEARTVADICRKVDGIALALELAAGRIGTHGLQGTAALLDGRLKLLWQGRRTALPRHQTLHATLDWSHSLIGERERTVLRRLSRFVGPFTLDAAEAVASDDGIDPSEVAEDLAQLAAKSLVVTDTSEDKARYRLLDTTRSYAHAKLDAAGEVDATARKHALYYAELLDLFKARNRKLGEFGTEHVANARAGLAWCFSAAGDAELAVRLANGATRLFREFSLLGECWQWCDRALRILPETMRDTYWELNLHASIGYCLMFTQGNSEQTRTAFEKGLTIARALGDYFYQFRLLAGLHMYYRRQGEFGRLLAIARQAEAIAPALEEPTAIVGANVMLGISHHLAGSQAAAHAALSASLEQRPNPYSFVTNYLGFHQDRKMVLARTLWLQGFPDRALALMHEAGADEPADPVTGCLTLIWGTSLLLWTGELAKAEGCVERLIQRAGENSLQPYKMVGVGFRGDLLVRRGDTAAGLGLLRESLKTLRAGRYGLFVPCLERAMAEGLAALGQLDLALARSTETIAAIGSDGNVYNAPELLRVHAEILMKAGDERAAERALRDSGGLADRQGALSWRLRSATSLARLLSRQSRPAEARAILAEAYAGFSEGFGTTDLKTANDLLAELERSASSRPPS